MQKIFSTSLYIFFLFNSILLNAQSNEVCGFIQHYFDETPVDSVKLYIENTAISTTTDEAGAFCINLVNKKNKLIFEREGYFETYIIAGSKDFFSVKMIKNTEADLALSKGLSVENIKAINSTNVSLNNSKISDDETVVEEEEIIDLPSRVAPPSLSASKASIPSTKIVAKNMLPAAGPKGPTGATGATGASSMEVAVTGSKAKRIKKSSAADDMLYEVVDIKKSGKDAPREILGETTQQKIKAGRLTAGEINDFSKWELWNDISENELSKYKDIWAVYPKERYAVQAVSEQGFPIVDATVTLNIDGKIIWNAKTDNTGKAELWNVLFNQNNAKKRENTPLKASIKYKGIENKLPQLKRFEEGINIITFKQDCNYTKNVDIAFVVDATGSMGDEIDFLKVELLDVIDRVQTTYKDLNIRLGNVFYRDKTDAYLTKNSPLTNNVKAGVAFIKDQKAGGGGDFPEAVDEGLEEAIAELKWSGEAVARILFLVLDAPPHQNETVNKKLQQTISLAAQKGVRIVPIVGSGIDKSTEYLLRSCALATNGHYIFLTDHSGIGGAHLKPSTDSYDVKNLNDLLVDIVSRYVQVPSCNAKDEPTVIGPAPSLDAKVSISPNPNDGRFLIESTTDLKELFITDANGKILIRFTDFVTGQNQVDIANFPTGTYYVRYQQDEKIVTKKVIKR